MTNRPIPFKRFLVPLDGTASSESVVTYMAGMAEKAKASLVLLRCIAQEALGVEAQSYLERVAAPLRKRGLGVATVMEEGDAGRRIVEASLKYETDMVAVMVHSQPGGVGDVMGAVISEVLRQQGEPVLLLRKEDCEGVAGGWVSPTALIVGLDGSNAAAGALPVVETISRVFGSEVVLVRSMLPADPLGGAARYYGAVDDFAENYLADVAGELRKRGLRVSVRTGHRPPEIELTAAAESHPGAIVVMTTRGIGGHAHTVLGSVTERVIRSHRHPVLAVPAARG